MVKCLECEINQMTLCDVLSGDSIKNYDFGSIVYRMNGEGGAHTPEICACEKINAPSRANSLRPRNLPNNTAQMFPADVLMVLPDKSEL